MVPDQLLLFIECQLFPAAHLNGASDSSANPVSWTYGGDLGTFESAIFAFKQANGFTAYLFNGISGFPSSGSWSGLSSNPGVSHIQVLARGVAEVPIPAAAWLFGSGLIGLAGIARRKKS